MAGGMPSINFTSPVTGELAGRLSKARSCQRSAGPCCADSSRRIPRCGRMRKLPPVLRSRAKDGSEGWSAPAFSRTMNFAPNRSSALPGNIRLRHRLTRKIKIRAAHEIMAARAAQLALFVDQLMTALRTISPVLAGNVLVGRRGAGVLMKIVRRN